MEEKLHGLVLSAVNYNDNDKILSVYTLEKGIMSVKVKGVKKANAKLRFVAEPFCFAEIIVFTSVKFNTLIGASLIDSFYPIRENIDKFFSASVILEFIKKFAREEMVSVDLFTLAVEGLKELAYTEKTAESVLSYFLIKGLEFAGYKLNLSGCVSCGADIEKTDSTRIFFDYNNGGFFCEECRETNAREIQLSTYKSLRLIEGGGVEEKNLSIKALKLLDYFIENRAEETLKTLQTVIKNG